MSAEPFEPTDWRDDSLERAATVPDELAKLGKRTPRNPTLDMLNAGFAERVRQLQACEHDVGENIRKLWLIMWDAA